MSVTFWIPKAPTQRVQPYADEPDFFVNEPVAPFFEINLANGNAAAMLSLIDPASVGVDGCYGSWGAEDLPRVRTATIKALNTEIKNRAQADPWESGGQGTGQCRIISGGRDAEYVTRTLERFLALTKVAMDHGMTVQFG
jgi:hypothetical protein